ncbi:WD repeat-containing protein 91 [Linnemannia schmuckeri]|uniref:WD repeat-containing protein 91 n=1 Tax=Linnemannia schmuckeri TaxID=64567 RepID=A0A9P5S217_9FUNG|nr:WD repeat-containing protein 91 [Linnemannia schmuckeri]
MNSIQHIDELVKEYLLFRGFTNSYKAFEADSKTDKDRGFQADKIIEELFSSIAAMDLTALLDHWRYLDIRYFSRLDHRFSGSVKKFELCLLRYYLIYAIQHKKREKVVEFFEIHGAELQGNPEWVRWFALPSLLCFNIDRLHRKALQCEIETLQSMIENMRKEIQSSDAEISSLRDQVALKKVTDRLAVTNARRLRAASDAASIAKSEAGSESSSTTSISEEDLTRGGVEEPFIIVSQEIFLEHQSGITHAKFSCEGTLISSCDAENIVRIWAYNGSSAMAPAKIANTSNILSLAWETRDRYIFLGTDVSLVRCFSLESRTVVHEIKTDPQFPRVRYLTYSPVEPILVCAVSSSDDSTGALLSVNMKTMTTEHLVLLDGGPEEVINAFGFNHNGQLVVTGDVGGTIKVYDIRSLTRIMEWSASSQSILSCTFSFDETSIYSVDAQGQLGQDSVHKPGHRLDSYPLQGFTSSTLSSAMMLASSSSTSVRSAGGGSIRSKSFMRTISSGPGGGGGSMNSSGAYIPRIQLESSGGTIAAVENAGENDGDASGAATGAGITGQTGAATSITNSSSSNSTITTVQAASSISRTSANGGSGSNAKETTSALTTMNIGPGQLLGWSADTDHLVMGCGNAGVLVQTNSGQQVQPLLGHSHPLTCVDWSPVVGACLTGSADGTIRISKLMRV